jgi:hypothetical protein
MFCVPWGCRWMSAVFARTLIGIHLQMTAIQQPMKKTKTSSGKKKDPDRIEVLVKEHLANIAAAEDTFKIALALLERHKAKYAELEQYAENVSPSDRTISLLDNVQGSKGVHHIFKIVVTGVEATYQVTHPERKDHSNVDKVAWISDFEEVLAKAITQIILARQSESPAK